MRVIPNTTETLTNPASGQSFPHAYAEMIRTVVSNPLVGEQGFDIAKQRRVFRILDVLDAMKEGDAIVLEDADWEFLKGRTEAFPWGFPDRAFGRFADAVVGAEKT